MSLKMLGCISVRPIKSLRTSRTHIPQLWCSTNNQLKANKTPPIDSEWSKTLSVVESPQNSIGAPWFGPSSSSCTSSQMFKPHFLHQFYTWSWDNSINRIRIRFSIDSKSESCKLRWLCLKVPHLNFMHLRLTPSRVVFSTNIQRIANKTPSFESKSSGALISICRLLNFVFVTPLRRTPPPRTSLTPVSPPILVTQKRTYYQSNQNRLEIHPEHMPHWKRSSVHRAAIHKVEKLWRRQIFAELRHCSALAGTPRKFFGGLAWGYVVKRFSAIGEWELSSYCPVSRQGKIRMGILLSIVLRPAKGKSARAIRWRYALSAFLSPETYTTCRRPLFCRKSEGGDWHCGNFSANTMARCI